MPPLVCLEATAACNPWMRAKIAPALPYFAHRFAIGKNRGGRLRSGRRRGGKGHVRVGPEEGWLRVARIRAHHHQVAQRMIRPLLFVALTALSPWSAIAQLELPVRLVLNGTEDTDRQVLGLADPVQLDAAVNVEAARSQVLTTTTTSMSKCI